MAKEPEIVQAVGYQGCRIEIVKRDATEILKIDAQEVEISRDPDTSAYLSSEAPYETHGSLEELGKAIVDSRQQGT